MSERTLIQPQPPKIIFLHIPKTAGMALNGILDKNYRNTIHYTTHLGDIITAESWKGCLAKIQNMPAKEREQYGLFKGHMCYGLHEILSGSVEYLTFLRDPIKRFISHYQMLIRYEVLSSDHVLDPSKPDWNLGDHPAVHRSIDNYQTRILSGVDPDLPFGACTEEHLRIAKANMDRHFKFVGLTEQFALSLLLLKRVCGWRRHFYVPANVSSNRSVQLSAVSLEAIRDLNRFDFALYRHVEDRFQRLVSSYGWGLRVEHSLYTRGNFLHQRYDAWRRRLKKSLGFKRRS